MSKTIALVSCSKTKLRRRAPAKDLYNSPLFRKQTRAAQSLADKWFILSAKHGLLHPDTVIAPYDETLKTKSKTARKVWADHVFDSLRATLAPGDSVIFFAGAAYREFLIDRLKVIGCHVEVPLQGKSFGAQSRALSMMPEATAATTSLTEFYKIMRDLRSLLNGGRILSQCDGKMVWPKRGVYFLEEPGEHRKEEPEVPRIIRVGTHAVSRGSKATLWSRLSTHKGQVTGVGQHRSSVFRLHVGAALLTKAGGSIPTWGKDQSAPKDIVAREADLERKVSEYIGRMRVLWLDIPDEAGPASDRSYIERNSIALLSKVGGYFDPPSSSWLGRYSPKKEIRSSGLWNVNYVDDELDVRFLGILRTYVDVMAGTHAVPATPLAPVGWYPVRRSNSNQLSLFADE